jgi:cytochrome c556
MAKIFSLVYRQLVKWFVDSLWPWFLANVWPDVQKLLNEILEQVLRTARSQWDEWANGWASEREQAAMKKAAEADDKVQRSQNEVEAQEHRAVAQVWRQLAEQFRRENEELKAKLDEVLGAAQAGFRDEMAVMNMKDVIQECDDGTLKLAGSGAKLALPAPSQDS